MKVEKYGNHLHDIVYTYADQVMKPCGKDNEAQSESGVWQGTCDHGLNYLFATRTSVTLRFFSVEYAMGATAVVHLANNIFKLGLVGKTADYKAVVNFAVPASILAIIGALLLNYFAGVEPLAGPNCKRN